MHSIGTIQVNLENVIIKILSEILSTNFRPLKITTLW